METVAVWPIMVSAEALPGLTEPASAVVESLVRQSSVLQSSVAQSSVLRFCFLSSVLVWAVGQFLCDWAHACEADYSD